MAALTPNDEDRTHDVGPARGQRLVDRSSSPFAQAVLSSAEPSPAQEALIDPPTRRSSTRSVTWNVSPARGMAKRGGSIRQLVEADGSSGDETTGILSSERGGRRGYKTNDNGSATGAERSGSVGSLRPRRRDVQERTCQEQGPKESWWRHLADKYGSVELENKGSVARDHLALERTFLAWLRTSLSFASIGIAVTQLFRLNTSISDGETTPGEQHLRHVGKPLGATFIAISIVILFIGFHRYFESQHYVIRGKFPASRGSIVLVSLIAGALIVVSLVVILVVAPKAFEKR